MNLKSKLTWCFKQDWFLSFLILGIYLLTNRYTYGWDDQHLEIPLLKHLIDPTLYQGDYYVESLAQNFTSYVYPILARLITVSQVPTAYLFLFMISRYFLFYWWLKLWHLVAVRHGLGSPDSRNSRMVAVCCVLYALVLGRTEEFLYRTFSHQEFSLAIVFAAVYFFYKDRFILAAILFGIAANFHALYALFPMTYMSVYLLFFHHERRFQYWLKTGFTFVGCCLPFLIWTLSKMIRLKANIDHHQFDDWIQLYLLACPQNFPFAEHSFEEVLSDVGLFVAQLKPYLILIILYVFNFYSNDHFRKENKIHAISLTATVLIAICFYSAYASPNRFILDLNLIRNEQFLRFFLFGYLIIAAVRMAQMKNLFYVFFVGIIIALAGRNDFLGIAPVSFCVALILFVKSLNPHWQKTKSWMIALAICLFALAVLEWLKIDWKELQGLKFINYWTLIVIPLGYAVVAFLSGNQKRFRAAIVLLPIIYMIGYYCYYHYQYVQVTTKGGGFWQMQRNWEDMQRYVQGNTPKQALILIPYNMEMGGFRIQSERKIVTEYRDCGIIGFDYAAAKEWQRRIGDIEEFKIFVDPQSIMHAVINALFKYKVDYIVFMRYYAPGDNPVVKKIYENEIFALYQVVLKRN